MEFSSKEIERFQAIGSCPPTHYASSLVAAREGKLSCIKWLPELGYDTYPACLIWAAESGHLEVVKWLRFKGCPLLNSLALTWAAQGDHLEVVKWLWVEGCPRDLEMLQEVVRTAPDIETAAWLRERLFDGVQLD